MNRPIVTGIMGGSFNPVHIGHMMVASWMAQFAGIDEVWLSLSPLNPLKSGIADTLAADTHRLEMLRLAAEGADRIGVCDIELSMPRPSYTYTTLRHLAALYPDRRFRLIVGSDNWLDFGRWRDADRIVGEFGVTVYPRPGYDIDESQLPGGVSLCAAPTVDLSSTLLRAKIAEGADMTYFLPHGVSAYISRHKLYSNEQAN